MINLLPQPEKKELLRERWLRFVIVVLWSVLVLELLSVVLFTPAYYALYLSTSDLSRNLSERRALIPKDTEGAGSGLTVINKEIAILKISPRIVDVPPSLLLQEVILQKPVGIDLYTFAYVRTADTVSIQFSGTAPTQEDLLAFRRNVKMNPRVLDFKYGGSFVTKKTNIDFTTMITFQ